MAKGSSGDSLQAAVFLRISENTRVGLWKHLAAARLTSFIPISPFITLGSAKWPG